MSSTLPSVAKHKAPVEAKCVVRVSPVLAVHRLLAACARKWVLRTCHNAATCIRPRNNGNDGEYDHGWRQGPRCSTEQSR